MSTAIKFGTSGWRAIVADEFTVANIRLAVAGIAEYVKTQPKPHRVLVGRDPRFLGESVCRRGGAGAGGSGRDPDRDSRRRADAGDLLRGAHHEDLRAPSTSRPRTIRRNTTGSSFPRMTARRRCPK